MARGQRYGDLEHAVLVARGDLLGSDPVGEGQAPLEAAVAELAEAAALLLLLRPALAGDGEGRALQGDLDVGRVDTGEVTAQDEIPVLGARLDRRPPGAAGLEEGVEIAIQIEEAAEERPRHVVRPRLGDQAVQHMSSLLLSLDFLRPLVSTGPRAVKGTRPLPGVLTAGRGLLSLRRRRAVRPGRRQPIYGTLGVRRRALPREEVIYMAMRVRPLQD